MKRTIASITFAVLGCVVVLSFSSKNITIDLKKMLQQPTNIEKTVQIQNPTPVNEQKDPTILEATASSITIQRNATLTPGDVIQNLPLDLLCMDGYTTTVRNVSKTTKKNVFELYNISYPPKENTYVIDHLIPLELGGSNSIKNLWPQPIEESSMSAKMKDKLENALHTKVCEGSMSLSEAQSIFSHDWLAWYEGHFEKQ